MALGLLGMLGPLLPRTHLGNASPFAPELEAWGKGGESPNFEWQDWEPGYIEVTCGPGGALECESSPGPEEASPELRAGEQREGAIERWATPRAPGRRPPAHGFFPRAQPEPGAVALRTFVGLV